MTIAGTTHRPWPLPARQWSMTMRWHDLLFIHWPLDPGILRPLIPPFLELDVYDAKAWLGVVPFRMTGVRPRFAPPLPCFSSFAEINVRTYVTAAGKRGVWFFSLDAANRPAVWAARRFFHLPYYFARISSEHVDGRIVYQSARKCAIRSDAQFVVTYSPTGEAYRTTPGSIDHWLTERYCLYATDQEGCLYRGEIHHDPWPLQPAAAEIRVNTMAAPLGIELPDVNPLLHFAHRLDVVAWKLELC
jgi:uncharacterized protein YqjF (DUF2071 family)